MGEWSLLPLFLSCLGSLLAPNLCRFLATEAEILARAEGGGRDQRLRFLPGQEEGEGAVCPKLCACLQENRVGVEGRGAA